MEYFLSLYIDIYIYCNYFVNLFIARLFIAGPDARNFLRPRSGDVRRDISGVIRSGLEAHRACSLIL